MSAGDFLILKNLGDSAALGNTGSNLDALWDNEVIDEGSAATYSAGTFTLTNTAPYLIMYSERFFTENTTNNERIEGQGRIRMNGVDLTEAACEGYIRKTSGQQTMVINGVGIYNATAGDTFTTRFYRADNSVSGLVNRVAGFGGVQIIELDAADDFARYSTTATNTLSSTESNVSNWNNDQQETGFSRSSDTVTITTAGRYLMTVSGETSQGGGTSRIGATIFLERGTTEVTGVRGYSHQRGADSNQNGALSFAGIIDVAANDQFTLRSDADSGSMTLDSGAVWQFWQLPSGNETVVAEATNGNMNADAEFAWDTLPHIDTAAFTATAGSTDITVDSASHSLMFWNQGKKIIDGVQRGYPFAAPAIDGVDIDYAGSAVYHRNSGGIGAFATHGGASILPNLPSNSVISLSNSILGATGTMDVESGHWSILNLEGLYKTYTYVFPVGITSVDGDDVIGNNQLNVVITGVEFGATQGSGIVELVEFSSYSGTKVTQVNIDSWADTSIQVDIIAGALSDAYAFLFVTNDLGGQDFITVQVGFPPETYKQAQLALSPTFEHYWTFQNTYVDEMGSAPANGGNSGGAPTFETVPIVKGDTHSFLINVTTEYVSASDQSDMNTSSIATRRMMSGWIMLDSISQSVIVVWEEGAQVNNYAWLVGFGNSLMIQFADDGGDYVQIYFPVKLTPNRPYHVYMEFNASGVNGGVCRGLLDGVPNILSNGNPWTVSAFPSHSGNISWGHEGTEQLQVGDSRGVDNVDIAFASPTSCYYAHFISMQQEEYTTEQIRVQMFEKGALQQVTIEADTQVNMQTAIDAESDTLFPDSPCSIEIELCSDGDFSLTLDNITFDDRVSIPIRYIGQDTLTLILTNGSDLDDSKLSTPYGGTIVVQRPATFTIENAINGAEIRIYDNDVGGNDFGTELSGAETNTGTTYIYSHDGVTNDIIVQHMANGYEEIKEFFQLNSTNQTLTLDPEVENNT